VDFVAINFFFIPGVEPWTFEQYLGEAVFIPAGCPHQVRNRKVNKEHNFILFFYIKNKIKGKLKNILPAINNAYLNLVLISRRGNTYFIYRNFIKLGL
jgi:hypothetical protein